VAFVVAVVYTDWRYRRIPNAFTYPVMLVGLVLGGFEAVPGEVFANGLLDHVAGLVVGFLIAYPFYAMGGLKAGDGKYLMAVGAMRGLSLLRGRGLRRAARRRHRAGLHRRAPPPTRERRGRLDGRRHEDMDPVRRGARARHPPRARGRAVGSLTRSDDVISITTPVSRRDRFPVYSGRAGRANNVTS